jgi:hypothetical protein
MSALEVLVIADKGLNTFSVLFIFALKERNHYYLSPAACLMKNVIPNQG